MTSEVLVPKYSLLGLPSRYLTTADARIHYCTMGEGAPLVLLHGMGSSCLDWFPVAPGLAANYRLVLIDLRGHGQSSLAYQGGYAIERMVTDVGNVLDHLGIEKTHMLGLSLGGCVSLQFALNHGDRINRLVLVNTFARLRSNGWRFIHQRLSRIYAATRDIDELAKYVAASLFQDPQLQTIVRDRMRRNDLGAIRRTMIGLVYYNILNQIDQITSPTLVLIGDRDTTVPRKCADDLMIRLPRAQLRVLSNAGHALPYDQPERFLDVTLNFLAR